MSVKIWKSYTSNINAHAKVIYLNSLLMGFPFKSVENKALSFQNRKYQMEEYFGNKLGTKMVDKNSKFQLDECNITYEGWIKHPFYLIVHAQYYLI